VSSVTSLLRALPERFGARPALVELGWNESAYSRGRVHSYADLSEATWRFADALARHGLRPGDRVAVLLDNSAAMVVTEWACLLTGCLWVALNARSSPEEHRLILQDCAPAALVVSRRHRAAIPRGIVASLRLFVVVGADESADGLDLPVEGAASGADGLALQDGALPLDWTALLAGAEPRLPFDPPGAEDPVRIRYTSGTAGRPKGAVLPRRCYDASVEVVGELIGPLASGDVLAQVAPMTHAAGAMWLPHAAVGATALLADRFDAAAFADLVRREGVTAAFLVPTMLLRFLEAIRDPVPLASLRSIVYGGASMPTDRLVRGLDLLGPVFVQIYGMTESNWPVAALRREDHLVDGPAPLVAARLASCGRPTPIGRVRLVDRDGNDVARGEVGELLLRGRNTMSGYWRSAPTGLDADGNGIERFGKGLDADGNGIERFGKGLDAEGWMHSGDLAFQDADGFLTIVDRLHDMIVSGGFNVYPREVEDALSTHPAVLESAVVGRPDAEWGETVHAVVVLRAGAHASAAELAAHVAARTAAYKKPRSVEFVEELPKNAAGKVLRRALRPGPATFGGPGALSG